MNGPRAARLATVLVLFLGASTLIGAAAVAQGEEPALVLARLDRERATVGDHLTLTVAVEHEPDIVIEAPDAGADLRPLEVLEVGEPRTRSIDGGRLETRLEIVLAAFQTGDVIVPPLAVPYRQAGGGQGSVTTPPLSLLVESVIPPGEAPSDIRHLKPQAAVAGGAPDWIWATLVTAGFLGVTALTTVLMAYAYRQPSTPPLPVRPPAPDQVARSELERLASLDLSRPREVREYYRRLAACLRRYLSDRYAFPAFAMTTRELEERMAAQGVDQWPARLVVGLLQECDAVQYAQYVPAPERARADLTSAHEIIELTRPGPVPDQGAEAPASP